VIGRVVAVHIDDAALTPDGRIDVVRLRPIARLGYKEYTSVDSVFEMEKSTPEDRRG
jgi:flavin reductase (DIM6/NTAB) family NADH-FMN oxidoreductase RutF